MDFVLSLIVVVVLLNLSGIQNVHTNMAIIYAQEVYDEMNLILTSYVWKVGFKPGYIYKHIAADLIT